uniref:Uncharacterized protein n=1 Tax=Rhizophora mucronata TaxID=61149 RepID=A0A2P2K5P9_RHIMU
MPLLLDLIYSLFQALAMSILICL